MEVLEAYLDGRPHAYLEEMQQFLYDESDVEASLEKLNFSRKLATNYAEIALIEASPVDRLQEIGFNSDDTEGGGDK